MIRSRLSVLLAEKGHREKRKLTYRTVASETGLSLGVLVRMNAEKLSRVEADTLDGLCNYLECGLCDLIERVPEE